MKIVISANNIATLSCGCFAAFSVTPDCPFSFFVASATGIEVNKDPPPHGGKRPACCAARLYLFRQTIAAVVFAGEIRRVFLWAAKGKWQRSGKK
jgi:hypothetical protein